ncbi:CRISPR-associated endonuclease Cas2 [Corynebacterium sp. p3-SID1056]|uniref:CRISPR-associated endonuclease Cas2 n=1 Tax=Corynebacterium sp. p3-SID1056 TaxID=2916092 RepID=UPI0021A5CB41|nr:CRISPR-associated endonuclease Cas2 [Corynebacterium sp. p3-SID1056]
MWCVVMFDLPTNTSTERKEATRFRNTLKDLGFCRAQFSVYVQYFPLAARITKTVKSIKLHLPAGGDVQILTVTDTQWAKAIRFSDARERKVEERPSQLTIF